MAETKIYMAEIWSVGPKDWADIVGGDDPDDVWAELDSHAAQFWTGQYEPVHDVGALMEALTARPWVGRVAVRVDYPGGHVEYYDLASDDDAKDILPRLASVVRGL